MILAKIENGIVTEVIDTDTPEQFPEYEEVPSHVYTGADVRFYHEGWKPKTEQELIAEGLIEPEPEDEPEPEPEPLTPEQEAEQTAADVRAERDYKIQSIRWRIERNHDELALGLEPTEPLEPLLEYVQQLRDVPQQDGFPDDIDWPQKPGVL